MFSYLAAMVIAEIALERVEGAHNGADALEVSVLFALVGAYQLKKRGHFFIQ